MICQTAAPTWPINGFRPSSSGVSPQRLPRCRDLLGVLGDVRPAFVGEGEGAPPAVRLGPNQTLVLQLLQRGVDRARARLPCAAAAFGDLLDDLVAVHRLLGEHGQDRGADVAPAGLHSPPASAGGGPRRHERGRSGVHVPVGERVLTPTASTGHQGEPGLSQLVGSALGFRATGLRKLQPRCAHRVRAGHHDHLSSGNGSDTSTIYREPSGSKGYGPDRGRFDSSASAHPELVEGPKSTLDRPTQP